MRQLLANERPPVPLEFSQAEKTFDYAAKSIKRKLYTYAAQWSGPQNGDGEVFRSCIGAIHNAILINAQPRPRILARSFSFDNENHSGIEISAEIWSCLQKE